MTSALHQVLALRLAISQSAVAKYKAILNRQDMGRVRDTLIYCGAPRTGRWAGRALQLQNLKRPPPGVTPDKIAQEILQGSFKDRGLKNLAILGGSIRASVCASEGHSLVVCDLASIESRVLGWVANDPGINRVFAEGLDVYKAFAAEWLHKPYEAVTKAERNLAKPPALGCGYGLGADGLGKYAQSMGITLTFAEAQSAVDAFRRVYARVPVLWKWLESAFRQVIQAKMPVSGYGLKLYWKRDMLVLQLPSGRGLYYKDAQITLDGDIAYWGQNSFTHKWELIRTYGARLVENVVQAIARDVLAHGMQRANERQLTIVGHVHDEIICEMPEQWAETVLDCLRDCMTEVPAWAPGLLLAAEGYTAKRYKKD